VFARDIHDHALSYRVVLDMTMPAADGLAALMAQVGLANVPRVPSRVGRLRRYMGLIHLSVGMTSCFMFSRATILWRDKNGCPDRLLDYQVYDLADAGTLAEATTAFDLRSIPKGRI